jgi:hypothetical protein
MAMDWTKIDVSLVSHKMAVLNLLVSSVPEVTETIMEQFLILENILGLKSEIKNLMFKI